MWRAQTWKMNQAGKTLASSRPGPGCVVLLVSCLFRGLDGNGEALGLELFLVKLGALLVGGEEEGDAGLVGLLHAHLGVLGLKGGELDDRVDHEEHVVLVVVVQQDLPRREVPRRVLLRGLLARLFRLHGRRGAAGVFFLRGWLLLGVFLRHKPISSKLLMSVVSSRRNYSRRRAFRPSAKFAPSRNSGRPPREREVRRPRAEAVRPLANIG